MFAYPDINTRGVGRILDSYANPRRLGLGASGYTMTTSRSSFNGLLAVDGTPVQFGDLGGVYMTPWRLSRRGEFTPVPSHGSTFVYMIPLQNVIPARVAP